jgi:thiamine biosynthesis lipoprotein
MVAAALAALAVLLVILLAAAQARGGDGPTARDDDHVLRRARLVMGTLARVDVWAADAATRRRSAAAAFAALVRVDSLMSTWRADSDVLRVNRGAGRDTVAVAPEVIAVIATALDMARRSDGAFDPTVLPLLRLWGFRAGLPRCPGPDEIRDSLARVGYELVYLDAAAGRVHLRGAGVELDLGGIAKGYAVDLALDAALGAGSTKAVVDLGGNLGTRGGESGGRVAIRDPRDRDAVIGDVVLDSGCIATSGASERHIVVDGERLGHILDPRTGTPVSGPASVSVVAPSGMLADALATAIYVLGTEAGLAFARQWPEVEVLVLKDDGSGNLEVEATPGMDWQPVDRPGR